MDFYSNIFDICLLVNDEYNNKKKKKNIIKFDSAYLYIDYLMPKYMYFRLDEYPLLNNKTNIIECKGIHLIKCNLENNETEIIKVTKKNYKKIFDNLSLITRCIVPKFYDKNYIDNNNSNNSNKRGALLDNININ